MSKKEFKDGCVYRDKTTGALILGLSTGFIFLVDSSPHSGPSKMESGKLHKFEDSIFNLTDLELVGDLYEVMLNLAQKEWDGWIEYREWDIGKCPSDIVGKKIEIEMVDGDVNDDIAEFFNWGHCYAGSIMRYRVIE